MLGVLLTFALGCAELCRAEAIDHYAALLADGGYGKLSIERAAFLIRESDGTLTLESWTNSGFQRAVFRGSIPRGTIAVIHTHPQYAPEPSAGDRAEARRIRLPVIVITPSAVVAAHPDGSVSRIADDRRWWSSR